MLVAPGATAHLLTDRLARLLGIACVSAVLSAFLGYLVALRLNTSVAGSVAAVAGAQFALAVLLAPRHGVAARALTRIALSLRIDREDVLGALFRAHERGQAGASINDVASAVGDRRRTLVAVRSLRRRGMLAGDKELRLTPSGLDAARALVRIHRLWESFLARELELPLGRLHDASHRAEHFITPEMQARLDADRPAKDPHGREIPRARGE
jgi:Mn-dependent DtxR family transcriptional regulator